MSAELDDDRAGPANPFRLALTPAEILTAAAARGLPIPDACMDGVVANMALLASHAIRLDPEPSSGAAE